MLVQQPASFRPDANTNASHNNLASSNSSTKHSIGSEFPRPRLSMVWRKEFDGQRERLVAHWIINPDN